MSETDSRKKLIYIMDPDSHVARFVEMILRTQEYKTKKVYSLEGLQLLIDRNKPDMIVMEVNVEGGLDFVRKVVAENTTPDPQTGLDINKLPIVILSRLDKDLDIFAGWQTGCDSYLTKPFNPQELITIIRRIFDSPEEIRAMIEFRLGPHLHRNTDVVEILFKGEVVGVIYPLGDNGIKIVSAHIQETRADEEFSGEVIIDDGSETFPPIPSVNITFNYGPYIITPQGIRKIGNG